VGGHPQEGRVNSEQLGFNPKLQPLQKQWSTPLGAKFHERAKGGKKGVPKSTKRTKISQLGSLIVVRVEKNEELKIGQRKPGPRKKGEKPKIKKGTVNNSEGNLNLQIADKPKKNQRS